MLLENDEKKMKVICAANKEVSPEISNMD